MSSWLCILNRENFKVVREKLVWGVDERHKNEIQKAKPGDLCAFYLIVEGTGTKRIESAIGGISEIDSKPYEDHSDIFPYQKTPNDTYPYRVKLGKMEVFEPELQFKQLIPDLSFITNKKNYSSYMLGRAMRTLPKEDIKKILDISHR